MTCYEGLLQRLSVKDLSQITICVFSIFYETVSLSEGFITERLVMKNYYSV